MAGSSTGIRAGGVGEHRRAWPLSILALPRARQIRVRAECSAVVGGVILVARFAAGAVLNYAFGLGLAWLLVPARFGMVSAVQNVLLLAAGLLNAGLPWALAIRVAKTHGDHQAAKPEFRTALIANLGLGLVLGAAFMATQLPARGWFPPAPRSSTCWWPRRWPCWP